MLYCALAKLLAILFLHYLPYLGLIMNMEKGFCTFFQQQHHYLGQQPNGKHPSTSEACIKDMLTSIQAT
jgi:hypothetical protein